MAVGANGRSVCITPDSSPKMSSPWSSLLTKLPNNAGVHSPRVFYNVESYGSSFRGDSSWH